MARHRQSPQAQPRIPGVRRKPRHTSLLPVINVALEKIAKVEHKRLSYVAAELIGDLIGLDAATGEPLDRKTFLRRWRAARRIFLRSK